MTDNAHNSTSLNWTDMMQQHHDALFDVAKTLSPERLAAHATALWNYARDKSSITDLIALFAPPTAPYQLTPGNLVSLKAMLQISGSDIFSSVSYVGVMLGNLLMIKRYQEAGIEIVLRTPLEERAQYLKKLEIIRDISEPFGLKTVGRLAQIAFDNAVPLLARDSANYASHELDTLIDDGTTLLRVLALDMEHVQLMTLSETGAADLLTDKAHFGDDVASAFPSAQFELNDAARCRALQCWTASVMHLMRALETPLACLARHCGVDGASNWNKALNEIEARLRDTSRRSDGADAEQWASEAAAHLRAVKNAWRNHAAHGQARYSREDATAIWDNSRALMQTLAKHLNED